MSYEASTPQRSEDGRTLPLSTFPERVAVGHPKARVSMVWRFWSNKKSDVFVAARHAAHVFKASLHASGMGRLAYTSEFVAGNPDRVPPEEDRLLARATRPLTPGLPVLALQLIVPFDQLQPWPEPQNTKETFYIAERPDATAVQLDLTFIRGGFGTAPKPFGWPGYGNLQSRSLAEVTLPNSDIVWLTYHYHQTDEYYAPILEAHRRRGLELSAERNPPKEGQGIRGALMTSQHEVLTFFEVSDERESSGVVGQQDGTSKASVE